MEVWAIVEGIFAHRLLAVQWANFWEDCFHEQYSVVEHAEPQY